MATPAGIASPPSSRTFHEGEGDLCARVRSFGVMLTLVPADRGVVLEGVSPTFYGKQMAQELARQARLVVVANRILVDRTAATIDTQSIPNRDAVVC